VTDDDGAYVALLTRLEREHGFQGALYRQKCLRRRVAVRMRARGAKDIADYTALLDAEPEESDRLLRTLTINVSRFFRNPETWDVIRRRVLPDLLGRRGSLLLWSAGAAAGEEAYSLAILVEELLSDGRLSRCRKIRIIGTDIDGPSLAAARSGQYPDYSLSETPLDLRVRWFTPGHVWRLDETVRSKVQFLQHDILTDRPSFDADFIVCRNLLIYLDRPAQEAVFRTFAEVLKPGGYLVLGRVETLAATVRSQFTVVDAGERIYQKVE
jgi:chemotaxis protein methyltransferase CheR